MARRQLPTVAVEPDKLDELREATRKAHEAEQAMRQAARDLKDAYAAVRGDVTERIQNEVHHQLEKLGKTVARHRELSVQTIERDMARYWGAMIGVDPSEIGSPTGGEHIASLLGERVVDRIDQLEVAVSGLTRQHLTGPHSLPHILRAIDDLPDWLREGLFERDQPWPDQPWPDQWPPGPTKPLNEAD
jgi:predicted DNA-binding transcriptional regulator YafY